jgi:superfamily II DNA or RNA helicase
MRDYQLEAYDALRTFYEGGGRRGGICLPTGCGKTHVMGYSARKVNANGGRSLTVLHRDTLVDQTVRRYMEFVPPGDIGVVKAHRNEVDKPVVIASIHTLRTDERREQIVPPDLAIVDEAHVSVAPIYRRLFDHLGDRSWLAGFTATWVRADNLGLGDVWQDVVYRRSIKWAVNRGYLVKPVAYQLGGQLDLSAVPTINDDTSDANGDYKAGKALGDAVMVDDLRDTVVKGYHNMAAGRSAVLFAPTNESARYFAEALRESGVPCAEIFAGTSPSARRYAFASFDNGAVKVLVTCTALAEGWDSPRCDTALIVRPTKHVGLFIQMVGRILRLWPGKTEGRVLDFVGVTDDKTMAAQIDLSATRTGGAEECPLCGGPLCRTCGLCREPTGCQNVHYMCQCPERDSDDERVPIEHMAKKIEGVQEVDLFAGTDARWLRTYHGVPFVSVAGRLVFVAQLDSGWAIGVCSDRDVSDGHWAATGLTPGDALMMGGELALELDEHLASKKSDWRQGNRKASDEQRYYAGKIGIPYEVTQGMNKAEISDAISVHLASSVLQTIRGTA